MIERIDKEDGVYEVSCDGCDVVEEYEAPTWDELITEIHRDGWTKRKDWKGEWEHFCPDCSKHKGTGQ